MGCEGKALMQLVGWEQSQLKAIFPVGKGMTELAVESPVSSLSIVGHPWWKVIRLHTVSQPTMYQKERFLQSGAQLLTTFFIGEKCHPTDFFFMHACLFTDSHVWIPFAEFTMGVLRTLNVAPAQLHLNSQTSLRAFRVLAEMFRLKPSLHMFLHFIVYALFGRLGGYDL